MPISTTNRTLQIKHSLKFVKDSKSSGYDGPDLRCFEVTNAFHKNINDNTVPVLQY